MRAAHEVAVVAFLRHPSCETLQSDVRACGPEVRVLQDHTEHTPLDQKSLRSQKHLPLPTFHVNLQDLPVQRLEATTAVQKSHTSIHLGVTLRLDLHSPVCPQACSHLELHIVFFGISGQLRLRSSFQNLEDPAMLLQTGCQETQESRRITDTWQNALFLSGGRERRSPSPAARVRSPVSEW